MSHGFREVNGAADFFCKAWCKMEFLSVFGWQKYSKRSDMLGQNRFLFKKWIKYDSILFILYGLTWEDLIFIVWSYYLLWIFFVFLVFYSCCGRDLFHLGLEFLIVFAMWGFCNYSITPQMRAFNNTGYCPLLQERKKNLVV